MTSWAFHRRDRFTIGLLAATMFVAAADLLIITPVLPRMARDLSTTIELAGLWVTAYAASAALFALIFGPISDRVGRRRVLLVGTLGLGLAAGACGFAGDYRELLATRFLAGAAAGALVTSITAFAGDHFDRDRRAIAMGWVMSGFYAAMILSVPLGAFLAETFGWHVMFRVYGGSMVALAVIMLVWLPHPAHEQRTARLTLAGAVHGYLGLLKDRRVLGVSIMSLAIGLSMTMFMVYSSPWLEHEFGLNTAQRGLVFAVGGPAVILGAPLAGWLSNRFGRLVLVATGSGLMGLLQLTMPLTAWAKDLLGPSFAGWQSTHFGNHPLPVVAPALLVLFCVMLAGSSRSTPFHTYALEIVPSGRRGTLSAIRSTFNRLGSAAGAALGSAIWATSEHPYRTVCVIAAFTTVLGVISLVQLARSAGEKI